MDKIAVLFPCYNEGITIAKCIADYRAVLPEAVFYVYDNNSADNTAAEALRAGAVLRREYQQGKGFPMRRMFQEVDAEIYVYADGDGTYLADNVAEMVRLVREEGADMVIGDRLSANYAEEETRPFHNIGNGIVRKSISVFMDTDCKDALSGLRVLSYRFAKTFPITTNGFDTEAAMTMHGIDKKMRVLYVPTPMAKRPQGSVSSMRILKDGAAMLHTTFRLIKNYRPLAFFGLLSLLLFGIGLDLSLKPLIQYMNLAFEAWARIGMVAGFFCLGASLLLLCTGIILETVHQQDKVSFEWKLQQCERQLKEERDM
ncbi:MAG: glycosyltransferase [Oscillospiraceae bacterium]|nr:glycosyltransferase [Oscillospiraceae bacterium]